MFIFDICLKIPRYKSRQSVSTPEKRNIQCVTRRYIEKMQKLNTLIIFTLFVCFFDISEARKGFPIFIIEGFGGE